MLKAKFITSLQFNNKLISDIEDKILFRLL